MSKHVWLNPPVPRGIWQSAENRKMYMQWLGKKLGYKKPEDWYKIQGYIFRKHHGSKLLSYYGDSPTNAVKEHLPDYDWKEWLFKHSPSGFWQSAENRRRYMDWLGNKLGYCEVKDWYQITQALILRNYGRGFLSGVGKSPFNAVKEHFPNFDWKEWKFKNVSLGFWDSQENRRRYIQWLGEELGFKKPEDWYQINNTLIRKNYGARFMTLENGSPTQIVKKYFPNYDWKEWLFLGGVPKGFWLQDENRYEYMKWLGEKLGYTKSEDWHKISKNDFGRNGGWGFLLKVGGSPVQAVKEYLPDYDWKEWLFKNAPNYFWESKKNRLRYMKWLGEELEYKKPEDWYQISAKLIQKNYGSGFLSPHQDSAINAVKEYFPNYEWKEWLFRNVPLGYWDSPKNRRRYMRWLGNKLGIENTKDWYQVTIAAMVKNKGGTFINLYGGSIVRAVMDNYPKFKWQPEKFMQGRKTQKLLYNQIRKILKPRKVEWEYREFSNIRFESGSKIGVDIFVPSLGLCIEYQGEQHFLPFEYLGGEVGLRDIKRRDREKRKELKAAGYTLLEIDYSWDKNESSLRDMIRKSVN